MKQWSAVKHKLCSCLHLTKVLHVAGIMEIINMIYEGIADITSAFQNTFSNACNILERAYFICAYVIRRYIEWALQRKTKLELLFVLFDFVLNVTLYISILYYTLQYTNILFIVILQYTNILFLFNCFT